MKNANKLKRALAGIGITAVLGGSALLGISSATANQDQAFHPAESASKPGGIQALVNERAASGALAKAETEVLKRSAKVGKIAKSDYSKAHNSYAKCMAAEGYKPSFRESSKGYMIELPYENVDPKSVDIAMSNCSAGNQEVRSLYRLQEANPQLLTDSRVVAVECLQNIGAVDTSYSPEQFERDWNGASYPFDPMANANNDCLYDAGYALFWED